MTPTDHLRTQWVEAAAHAGMDLRATPNSERLPPDADGVVATYAQVAAAPAVFRARAATRPTLVVFDEVHHTGDDLTWGEAITSAFADAPHHLLITGTPFRSDNATIPGVRYDPDPDGALVSRADFAYTYGQALADGVVRPLVFAAYAGTMTWRTSAGDVEEALLGDHELSRVTEEQAWKTALDTEGQWLPHVFAAAASRCRELRATGRVTDAATLVLAPSQELARSYAEVWTAVTGRPPLLILSDDPAASAAITRYRDDPSIECAVAVRMVTEGVDVPRAAVLVYATPASTPLFFAQAVGRVIRARRPGETAIVFLPAVRRLLGLAAEVEQQRDHVISPVQEQQPDDELSAPAIDPDTEDRAAVARWEPVSSSAQFDRVVASLSPVSDGLPGLLSADQEAALLARRDADAAATAAAATRSRATAARRDEQARQAALRTAQRTGTLSTHLAGQARQPRTASDVGHGSEVEDLRRQINDAVRGIVASSGADPRQVWAALYRITPGPKNAAASLTLLRRRRAAIAELPRCPERW